MNDRWWEEAVCQSVGRELFFHDSGGDEPAYYKRAKKICMTCPVRMECLFTAMLEEVGEDRRQRFGIRGGLTPMERFRLEAAA